jgi:hypothetical protein
MSAALLARLEAAGVHVSREGDSLRVRGEPGVHPAPYRECIREAKPALLALLALQDEIVRTASAARDAFSRRHYDRLWERWYALAEQEPQE